MCRPAGPEPYCFDPQRFDPDVAHDRPRFAYMPFGGGPHQCIGNTFALMEATLVLAAIAQRYRLRLPDSAVVKPLPETTLRPDGGADAARTTKLEITSNQCCWKRTRVAERSVPAG
ncbi:MAG: cytochrome P450 [Caldilineales bacterium]